MWPEPLGVIMQGLLRKRNMKALYLTVKNKNILLLREQPA